MQRSAVVWQAAFGVGLVLAWQLCALAFGASLAGVLGALAAGLYGWTLRGGVTPRDAADAGSASVLPAPACRRRVDLRLNALGQYIIQNMNFWGETKRTVM